VLYTFFKTFINCQMYDQVLRKVTVCNNSKNEIKKKLILSFVKVIVSVFSWFMVVGGFSFRFFRRSDISVNLALSNASIRSTKYVKAVFLN